MSRSKDIHKTVLMKVLPQKFKQIDIITKCLSKMIHNTQFDIFKVTEHWMAAPELTREQSAIFRVKYEKINIF